MLQAEYVAWQSFYAHEPWDGARLDVWMARLCAMFASRWSRRRVEAKRYLPDWYPYTEADVESLTPDRNARTANKIRAYFGALIAHQKESRGRKD